MFSKAERFKQKGSDVPAPGAYNLKWLDTSCGPASFDKSARFRQEDATDGSFAEDSICSETPRKLSREESTGQSTVPKPKLVKDSKRKPSLPPPANSAMVAELEKEIKRLTLERNSLSRELAASKTEITKLEGKFQMSVREKSALQAQVASLQKENLSLIRGKNILEAKVASLHRDYLSLAREKNVPLVQTKVSQEDNRKALEVQLTQLKSDKEKLQSDLATAEQTITDSTHTSSCLQQQLKSLEDEVETSKQAFQEKLAVAEGSLEEREKEIEKQKLEHQQVLESLTNKCLAFESEKESLEEQLAVVKGEVEESRKEREKQELEHQEALESLTKKCLAFEEELAHHKKVSKESQVLLQSQLNAMEKASKEQAKEYQTTIKVLNAKEDELTVLKCEVERMEQEQQKFKHLAESQKALSLQEAETKQMKSDLLARIAELEAENKRLQMENDKLSKAYAAIEERFRPYMSQVDELEDLNRLLRSQTEMAKAEADKLGDQYAKLLGHQNHKQKIQHVKKLKDENSSLKDEITKLRNEIERHKRNIRKLQSEKGVTISQKTKPLVAKN